MKLFFDVKIKRNLSVLLHFLPKNINYISAAIAYTHDSLLLDTCISRKITLDWWGLLNSENTTDLDIIRKAITQNNVKFYPFAEFFHPKVIWFHGYGLYIGSHNMTKSALEKNIEAGVFIEEADLSEENRVELNSFFEYLRDNSIPVTSDDVEKIDEYKKNIEIDKKNKEKIQSGIDDLFREQFSHLFILKSGVQDWGKSKDGTESKRKLLFLQEWREAQNFLEIVQRIVNEKCIQPHWVNADAEPSIITDQLLHAYYYTYVLKGNDDRKSIHVVNSEYEKNKNNQYSAIDDAINWWESLQTAPSNEDIHINQWSRTNKEILRNLKIRDLNDAELLTVMTQNHAAKTHARQIQNKFYNLPKEFSTDEDGRLKLYVDWIKQAKSEHGKSIHEILRYLLFQDTISIEERVFNVVNNPLYRLDHLGRSIVGEIIGWGRPEITHLRNNRVNKALRCLGYDVRLFSE